MDRNRLIRILCAKSYNVLSRLKGIETSGDLPAGRHVDYHAYNVLSRLKGIETRRVVLETGLNFLTMSFPV